MVSVDEQLADHLDPDGPYRLIGNK